MFRHRGHWLAAGILMSMAAIWMLHCANPVPPSGGPRDVTPPGLVEEESSPNLVTNFDQEEIRLTFNEWIQLKDPANLIVISPPLARRPDIALRSKTVVFRFHEEEELNPNTTYIINFGGAIVDLTENNPIENFTYVFSTGSFIDSLELRGSVYDALTGEPAKDTYVILHENLTDTAIAKLRPAYFTRTDEAGQFTFRYLRSDTFAVYVLTDNNGNYRYDHQEEKIGFLHAPLYLDEATDTTLSLPIFTEIPPVIAVSVEQASGGPAKVAFSRELRNPDILADDTDSLHFWTAMADTLYLWHTFTDTTRIIFLEDTTALDTVNLLPFRSKEHVMQIVVHSRTVHPDAEADIRSRDPLRRIDTAHIDLMLADTIPISAYAVSIDGEDPRYATIGANWQETGRYSMHCFPGAFTDIYGSQNDTIRLNFSAGERINFGQIAVTVNGLDSTLQYIAQLEADNKVVDERVISGDTTHQIAYNRLAPKSYVLTLIEDQNRNGLWDPGVFALRKWHEPRQTQTFEELRAGWDLDITVTWTK